MQAPHDDPLDQRKHQILTAHSVAFRTVKPIIIVISVSVDLISQLFIVKIERVLFEKHLVHNDPKREDIVFMSKVVCKAIVFGCTIRHREAWMVCYIIKIILLMSG